MKKTLLLTGIFAFSLFAFNTATAQDSEMNFVHITKLKAIMPEDGSFAERDSLTEIYNNEVIKKNEYILSHRHYSHFFTENSQDYLVIEEFKDFDSWTKSVEKNQELEEAAWPDEDERKSFLDAWNKYFKDWHGDMLMRSNPKLSKN